MPEKACKTACQAHFVNLKQLRDSGASFQNLAVLMKIINLKLKNSVKLINFLNLLNLNSAQSALKKGAASLKFIHLNFTCLNFTHLNFAHLKPARNLNLAKGAK